MTDIILEHFTYDTEPVYHYGILTITLISHLMLSLHSHMNNWLSVVHSIVV